MWNKIARFSFFLFRHHLSARSTFLGARFIFFAYALYLLSRSFLLESFDGSLIPIWLDEVLIYFCG